MIGQFWKAALARLPKAERDAWLDLWADVEPLLGRVKPTREGQPTSRSGATRPRPTEAVTIKRPVRSLPPINPLTAPAPGLRAGAMTPSLYRRPPTQRSLHTSETLPHLEVRVCRCGMPCQRSSGVRGQL